MSAILVVDDEAPVRELISRWLSKEGHSIHTAASAESALEVLAAQEIGVILCDRSMPGRDGLWLVDQVRERHPNVAIILATADPAVPTRVSLRDGVLGYLVKPFKAPQLLQAVADAVLWHRVAAKRRLESAAAGDPIERWLRGRSGRPPVTDGQ